MPTRHASGYEILLSSGEYEARIVTVGAGLASLKYAGRDLVVAHDADEIPEGYLGKTLMPWPNRIAGGAYTWEGVTYTVDVNEAATGSALHGLMTWVDWTIIHADSDSATLGAFIAPRYGYPWPIEAWVTYALSACRGLTVTLVAKNVGSTPAPYGVSSHPYLSLDGKKNDGYEVTIPASEIIQVDQNMAPVETVPVDDLERDFRTPRLLGSQSVDHAFTGLPEGEWTVQLRDPETGLTVQLKADTPWVQAFTADSMGRTGIAVEPMTCPPNAFNSGKDLIVLAPGQSHTMTFTIIGSIES